MYLEKLTEKEREKIANEIIDFCKTYVKKRKYLEFQGFKQDYYQDKQTGKFVFMINWDASTVSPFLNSQHHVAIIKDFEVDGVFYDYNLFVNKISKIYFKEMSEKFSNYSNDYYKYHLTKIKQQLNEELKKSMEKYENSLNELEINRNKYFSNNKDLLK